MLERSAYRFRIYPDAEQESLFLRTIGCCRLVYNLCLEQRRLEWHRSSPRRISAYDQMKELKDLKREAPFLKEVPHHALLQAIHDLQKAYVNFFEGRAEYPKPRKKFRNESFRFPDPKQLKLEGAGRKARVFLPKAGWVKMAAHREVVGDVKNLTVSKQGEWWFVSIQVEREIQEPVLKIGEAVGGDLGTVNALALSDGTVYDLPRMSEKERRREAALHRRVARRTKGSRNRARALRDLRSFKARVARRRRDGKHKMTSDIARRYGVYCGEDLRVANMTASARGTVEDPGSNVAQKAGLNRSLLDLSPGETRFQIEYKMRRAGGRTVFVNPAYTSQQCSNCLHIDAANRLDRDRFVCVSCGYAACADFNAARNIRRLGLEALAASTGGLPGMACGSSRIGGRKQEKKAARPPRPAKSGSPDLQGGE